MGKTKIESVEKCLERFNDIRERCKVKELIQLNNLLMGMNEKEVTIIFKLDSSLLDIIDKSNIIPIDLNNPDHSVYNEYSNYTDDPLIDIDPESLFKGDILDIKINNFEYPVSISKDSFPFKLKKAEYNNIGYKIYNSPKHLLSLSKKFISTLDNHSFTLFRLFQII